MDLLQSGAKVYWLRPKQAAVMSKVRNQAPSKPKQHVHAEDVWDVCKEEVKLDF